MKKLRLNHEDLRVESFGTGSGTLRRGTVKAHSHQFTCDLYYECSESGQDTCHNHGCNTGLSSICESEGVTDCAGGTTCEPASNGGVHTCYQSCTDVEGCSFCGAMC